MISGFIFSSLVMADNISKDGIEDQKMDQEQCVKLRLNECIEKCKESGDENCASLCKENVDNECKYAGE